MTSQTPPIFIINGTPAVGKSTVSRALMEHFDFGMHVPVDELREWVVSGLSTPIEWTKETTRQFRLAENAAALVSAHYNDQGFAVAIDHCEQPQFLDDMVETHFNGRTVVRVILTAPLDENLIRNRDRTSKDFESDTLVKSIRRLHHHFDDFESKLWIKIHNRQGELSETVSKILALA